METEIDQQVYFISENKKYHFIGGGLDGKFLLNISGDFLVVPKARRCSFGFHLKPLVEEVYFIFNHVIGKKFFGFGVKIFERRVLPGR